MQDPYDDNRVYECSRCTRIGITTKPTPLFQDVFGEDNVVVYFCKEHYEEQLTCVCFTCGDKLHVDIGQGCYKEVMLDRTAPGGVKELFFCEPHWHAWHRRVQTPWRPSDSAHDLHADGGPRCACGRPSTRESGTCEQCNGSPG